MFWMRSNAARLIACFAISLLAFSSGCNRTSSSGSFIVLRINEVSPRNVSVLAGEPNGIVLDWVEIFNPSDTAVRLEGYSLSDDPRRPNKFRFPPHAQIAAGGFVVIYLVGDGQLARIQADRAANGEAPFEMTEFHADFGLSGNAETLYLYANGRRIDRLGWEDVPEDASVGRFPDGGSEIGLMFAAAPGEANNQFELIAPRFALGFRPRPAICVDPRDEVAVTFSVLSDVESTSPEVRLRFLERPDCSLEDQSATSCALIFEENAEDVVEVDLAPTGGGRACAARLDEEGDALPPLPENEDCPPEAVNGKFGDRPVQVTSFHAFLPAGATLGETEEHKPVVLVWVSVENELGRNDFCFCYVYGSGCFDLVISEYQPVNNATLEFVRVDPNGFGERSAPDWLEIFNHGDEPIDLTNFGLAGTNAARNGNLRQWVFGRDSFDEPQYLTIGPGERRVVICQNDGGALRRQFRRVVVDDRGVESFDQDCLYYSTRFDLSASQTGVDGFVLTAPAGNVQVVIDEATLDFRQFFVDNPTPDPLDPDFPIRDLSFIRQPGGVPGVEDPRERFPIGELSPGLPTDCATPAGCSGIDPDGTDRFDCPKPPAILPELQVVPAGAVGTNEVHRCPELGEGVVVTTRFAIHRNTLAAFEAGETPSFRAEVEVENVLGERIVLTLDDGITVTRDETRQAEAPRGTVLLRLDAHVPPQPEGLVTVLRVEITDDLLAGELPEAELNVLLSRETLEEDDRQRQFNEAVADCVAQQQLDPNLVCDIDPAELEGRSRVGFGYFSGRPPVAHSGLIHEFVPQNESVLIPGFDNFAGEQKPDYIEIHLPMDAEVESIDLSGFFVTAERHADTPIREALRAPLPKDIPPIARGEFLLIVFGRVPPRELPHTTVSASDLGIDADLCAGTLHLIGPDELGNCLVDSMSWDCDRGDGLRLAQDRAFGPSCSDPSRTVDVTPSPGTRNFLKPVLLGARHANLGQFAADPNVCEDNTLKTLVATVLVDRRLILAEGTDEEDVASVVSNATFRLTQGSVSPVPSFPEVQDFDDNFKIVQFSTTFIGTGAEGTVFYDALFEDICGGSVSECDDGPCFSLRIDSGEAPELFINEVNRAFPIPGDTLEEDVEDGVFQAMPREWIEIFNPGSAPVDLGGMSLSDHRQIPRVLTFDDGTIVPARGALVVVTDGGDPLPKTAPPANVVVDFEWIPRVDKFNGQVFVGVNCGRDPRDDDKSAPPFDLSLIDRIDRGSCLIDSFHGQFPDPECNSPIGLGRVPDGGEIVVIDEPTPGVVEGPGEPTFIRGDVDGDGNASLTDAVALLDFLFRAAAAPPCLDALDVDDGGKLTVTDAVYLLTFLFSGGDAPPPPFPEPGTDPTADTISCEGL